MAGGARVAPIGSLAGRPARVQGLVGVARSSRSEYVCVFDGGGLSEVL